jgi:hypothetical protein
VTSAVAIVPPVSIVVRWPDAVPAEGLPRHVASRLIDLGIGATWAIEAPRQIGGLTAAVEKPMPLNLALLVNDAAKPALAETVIRAAASFEGASRSISALAIEGELKRGSFERTLCQVGIQAVVGGAVKARATEVRSLPFGIVELRPHVEAPSKGRLLPFGGVSRRLDAAHLTRAAVVNIDVSRANSGRSIRAIEHVMDQVAEAVRQRAMRSATISQLAGELSRQSAPRPQRSILRTAA